MSVTVLVEPVVTFYVSKRALDMLLALQSTGVFGHDVHDVAQRLLYLSLQERAEEGWLEMPSREENGEA